MAKYKPKIAGIISTKQKTKIINKMHLKTLVMSKFK